MLPSGAMLPDLPAPYNSALYACADAMCTRYDVVGILAAGTVVGGAPDQRSDLDLHVLHRGAFRERVQCFFEGVPCEIFVNPPKRIPRYFEEEARSRRPCTAHMFATGFVVYDPEGIVAELFELARASLAAAPSAPDEAAKTLSRYGPATMFEDAEDLLERDPEAARLLLGNAVYELVRCYFANQPAWMPRHKDFLKALRELDPKAAELAVSAGSGDMQSRFEAARALCLLVTGSDGFFEWTSAREET